MRNQKAPCENSFRAIQNALLASSACDVTGKVAFACARHGCYAPNSLVDMFKGEQQKNVDFSFLQALRTTNVDPEQGVMIIYDIACQYMVHLQDRIGQHLDPNMEIDSAIGLFHVHAHKDECLFRFATSFIPGAAVTAGEILESMWSTLNSISPTVRTATLAHRAEVLDDHCCDANHKKGLGIIYYLCKRQVEAKATRLDAVEYLDRLEDTAGNVNVAKWKAEILEAERCRLNNVKVMDIYKARVKLVNADQDDIPDDRPMTTLEHWMDFALIVEEKQLAIQFHVRRLARDVRDADINTIDKLRTALNPLLAKLGRLQASAKVPTIVSPRPAVPDHQRPAPREAAPPGIILGRADLARREDLMYWDNLFGIADDTLNALPQKSKEQADTPPECLRLALPSNDNVSPDHRALELKFRIRKAQSLLTEIRDLIAEKSFKYTDEIRNAPRKGVRTRGRTSIIELNRRLSFLCQAYTWNRGRMADLKADKAITDLYQALEADHVRCSTAVLNPNKAGSTKLKLSWVWQSVDRRIMAGEEQPTANTDDATLTECRCSSNVYSSYTNTLNSPSCTLAPRPSVGKSMV